MPQPFVIFNPAAKGEKASRMREKIATVCAGAVIAESGGPTELPSIAAQAVRDGFTTIVAAGGDGTINQVANGIAGSGVHLGLLPIGTMNVFAAELGIPCNNLAKAWEVVTQGVVRAIDLPRVSTATGVVHFVQLAGIGLDAQVVKETSWEFRKNFGPMSYLISAAEIAARKPPLIRIETDASDPMEGSFVLIGNGRYYGGPFRLFKEAQPDDGLLDVILFRNLGFLDIIRYLQGVLFGTHLDLHDVDYVQCRSILATSDEEVPAEVDGEVIGSLPIEIGIEPGGLHVLVPAGPKQA